MLEPNSFLLSGFQERGDVVIYELEVEELKSRSLTDRSAFRSVFTSSVKFW